jgi:hypothetical protein
MKYLALAVLALACTADAAIAQQDTLYGPRGFLGGVRADWVQIVLSCRARYGNASVQNPAVARCVRAEAKRRPVTQ